MEHISYEGINLAELLPRIPDSIKNDLPFGLVKLDPTGIILEYNMAEGELTGIDPAWAVGKNFFDDVALCTKTQGFYGKFLEGVKKGFMNTVFDYTFDHRDIATKVKVHMVTLPNHLGKMEIMLMVARANKPVITNAFASPAGAASATVAAPTRSFQAPASAPPATPSGAASPSIDDIVRAVMSAMNQQQPVAPAQPAALGNPLSAQRAFPPAPAPAPSPSAARPSGGSKHEDILKF